MTEEATQLTLIRPEPQRNPPALTPMAMLQIAVEKGAAIETMERLLALQERYEANEARKAYVAAKAAFYVEMPTVTKNKFVQHNKFWHATLDHIVEEAAPMLGKHGLTHSWTPARRENGNVEITCTLRHVLGHGESVTMDAPPDTTGSKNAVQAVISTGTYLERFTFMAVTGLAAKDQPDMDDRRNADFITADQKDALIALMKEVSADVAKFLKWLNVESIDQLPASQFGRAKAALEKKKAEHK